MMSAMAAAAVIRAHLGIFNVIFDVFSFSDSASNCASAEGCDDVGCSMGLEVVTETGESQR